ncbi:MAG: cytidylate kinase-like family protein [Deltaproteobacteria bacterium]|jgi:cytidylate kinase|nr:cytidylate kinase-like family protein [Deltaproteobacteria bacterium]MBW2490997.1 cytidylate kinase-like family protein [Deltaproteobacteria bacterium]
MAVITVSRQFGAKGKKIGRRIADTLGYYYADEDIIERAVVEIYVSPEGRKIFEAEPGDKLKRFISMLNPFGTSLMELPLSDKERYIDGNKYVELLNLIIPKIAKEGNAVIVGRGGQYILSDFKDAYHILLIAKEADRIKFIQDDYRVSRERTIQILKRMAKRRANLYNYFGKKDYDDPKIYDLVLNMSLLSIDKAEELICKLINA